LASRDLAATILRGSYDAHQPKKHPALLIVMVDAQGIEPWTSPV
jgi:hypothetical protein